VDRKGTVARKGPNANKISEVRELLKKGADLSHLNFLDLLQVEALDVQAGEPLRLQAEDFIAAIRAGRRPLVDAEDGFAAVRTADRIVAAARAAGSRMV
jgi:predicted dehydrogenase